MNKDNGNNKSREKILKDIRSVTEQQGPKNDNKEPEQNNMIKNNVDIKYVSNLDIFISKLKQVGATVSTISDKNKLVEELHRYVAENQVKSNITISKDENLEGYNWQDIEVTTNYDPQSLSVSVTHASMGIEETGTLVMLSSPSSPTGMNFLPDHHLVVLGSGAIVKTMEDVWLSLRGVSDELPRTVNLITGPSRTADIEHEIHIGAHGPKYLHVIIVDENK